MAKRNTLQEAEDLKVQFEKNHPEATIVIQEEKWEGFDPVYFILEKKQCGVCGHTWHSSAIGEQSACSNCQQIARNQRDPRSDEQVQADTAAWLRRSQEAEDWYE